MANFVLLLQPVAHALGGVASPGFHMRHLTGVLDRLYAAEHTQRHVGQLLVTTRILRSLS